MDVQKSLDPRSLKRYVQTRRFTGRRGLTPMKTKHRKTIPKTRGHRVEKKQYVQLRKHSNPKQQDERQGSDKNEHCKGEERKGCEDSSLEREREDTKKHTQIDQRGDTEDSEESIHPGLIQTLSRLPEQTETTTAVHETSDKKEIEAEELLPWS